MVSILPEADTQRQVGKYPVIKVLRKCIITLSLHLVNLVLTLYRILLSFIASSTLPPYCFNQLTISPVIGYNVYDII